MDITPGLTRNAHLVESYDAQGFRVKEKRFEGSILLRPDHVCLWKEAPPKPKADDILKQLDFFKGCEILLFGCGPRAYFMPPNEQALIKSQGFGFEIMDSSAAARSYAVLLLEERKVGALLLPYKDS